MPKWTVNAIINLGVALFFSPLLAYFGSAFIITYTDYMFLLYFIVIYVVESFLLSNIIKSLLSHHAAEFVEITLEVIGVLIQIQSVYTTRIYPEVVYCTSILPYMQLSWLISLSGISYNWGDTLDFDNTKVINDTIDL